MSSGRIATNLGFTGLPRQIYLLIGITFTLSLGRNIAFPYLAIYLTSGASNGGLGIDPSIVGFMLMVGGLTSIAMLLVTGSLCDRVGRRKMMLIYAVPLIFLTLALSYVTSPWEFMLVYGLMGVVGAFYDPAYNAMVADLVQPSRREEVYGLCYMTNNIGTVVGPLIGGFMLATTTYSALFRVMAAFVVAVSLAIFFGIKETNPSGAGRAQTGIGSAGVNPFRRDRLFLIYCLLAAMTNIVYSQFYGLLSVYTEYVGMPAYEFGILYSINGAMVVLLQIPIRKATMHIGSTKSFMLAQTLYAVGFSTFFFSRNLSQLVVGDIILTLGEITIVPAASGFIANLAPASQRGRYMAFASLSAGVGGSVGNYFGFKIYSLMTSKEYVWAALGAVAFLTLPGYAYMHMMEKRRLADGARPSGGGSST